MPRRASGLPGCGGGLRSGEELEERALARPNASPMMPTFMGVDYSRRGRPGGRCSKIPGLRRWPRRSFCPRSCWPRRPRRRLHPPTPTPSPPAGPVILFLVDNSASLPPLDPDEKRVAALEKMFTFLQGQPYRLVLFGGRKEIFVDDVSTLPEQRPVDRLLLRLRQGPGDRRDLPQGDRVPDDPADRRHPRPGSRGLGRHGRPQGRRT